MFFAGFACGMLTFIAVIAVVAWSCWPEFDLMHQEMHNGPNE